MSQPPDQPPAPPPPPPPSWGPPPSRPGRGLPIGLGIVIGVADAVLCVVLGVALIAVLQSSTNASGWFFAPAVVGVLVPVVLMFFPRTRWWGTGILIGFALFAIVVGGSCVALIRSLGG